MAKHVYVHQGNHISGWAVLITASLIFAFVKWLLLFAFLCAVGWAVVYIAKALKAHRAKRQAELDCLRARADYQNQLALQGDPLGMYGGYAPATMPLTDAVLDNYDDGLRGWVA